MSKYILLDAARLEENIEVAKEYCSEHLSLYKGISNDRLASVAPYLFSMLPGSVLPKWFFENGWGNAWGVIVNTKVSFEDCWKHLRKFLLVKTEDGQELYFRFYDPRVLKIFLPTCDEKQIIEFFGPVDKFIAEGETKEEAIEFSHQNGILKQVKYATEKLLNVVGVDGEIMLSV